MRMDAAGVVEWFCGKLCGIAPLLSLTGGNEVPSLPGEWSAEAGGIATGWTGSVN